MSGYMTVQQFAEKLAAHENILRVIVKIDGEISAREGFDTSVTQKHRIMLQADPAHVSDVMIEDVVGLNIGQKGEVLSAWFGPFTPWWAAEAIIWARGSAVPDRVAAEPG